MFIIYFTFSCMFNTLPKEFTKMKVCFTHYIAENEDSDYALRYRNERLSKEAQRNHISPLINGTYIACDFAYKI